MKRRSLSRTIEIETTVEIHLDDVLGEVDDDDLLAEVRARRLAVESESAEYLRSLAEDIELGRPLDATARIVIGARLREIAGAEKGIQRRADAYNNWRKERQQAQ